MGLTVELMEYFHSEFSMIFHLPKLGKIQVSPTSLTLPLPLDLFRPRRDCALCDFSDQVAVPDYPSGATEHWGLITYRESRLLYDETSAGASDLQGIAEIIAHELAHNVTPQLQDQF